MPPEVTLRPLREDEFADWDAAHRVEYAHGLVVHAGLSPEAADAKVAHDIPAVLPDGLGTENVHLWVAEADGRRRGDDLPRRPRRAAPGCSTSRSTQPSAAGATVAARCSRWRTRRARSGSRHLTLNVWGGNEVARGLYGSLGYVEESVHMRKSL